MKSFIICVSVIIIIISTVYNTDNINNVLSVINIVHSTSFTLSVIIMTDMYLESMNLSFDCFIKLN